MTASELRPVRIVADADVLAADLLVGGPARAALDAIRAHDWVTLVVSEPLLADVEAVVAALSDPDLARAHRERLATLGECVEHNPGDHPALACAHEGSAGHVLTLEEGLLGAEAGVAVRARVETSIKPPDAFARQFDAAALYEAVVGGRYPGPDRDPRE
jgi:predicted nucleic acid-binding protein